MIQYQWGQKNLTADPGTIISPEVTITPSLVETPQSQSNDTTGISPTDGYPSNNATDNTLSNTATSLMQNSASD
ncbi:hypothetical protein EDC04DRAFT_2688917 [Pisolithus marmoratus]|nr:hypothetical protein EDC04DRAFT_2688917 [Pisolithus marmoratus]